MGLPADHVELSVDNVHLPVADDDDIELSEFSISLDLPELFKVYEKLRSTGIELYDTKEELRKANEKIISLEEQLKSVNETVEMSDAKYKKVSKIYGNYKKRNYIDETPIPKYNVLHIIKNSK